MQIWQSAMEKMNAEKEKKQLYMKQRWKENSIWLHTENAKIKFEI